MEINLVVRTSWELDNTKEWIERIAEANLKNKLDGYLNKFSTKDDAECYIELNVKKNNKWMFEWKLNINLDGEMLPYSRENYNNLDDLINHLFDKFKEYLAHKKKNPMH